MLNDIFNIVLTLEHFATVTSFSHIDIFISLDEMLIFFHWEIYVIIIIQLPDQLSKTAMITNEVQGYTPLTTR
jgi:hypothetical protein